VQISFISVIRVPINIKKDTAKAMS